MTSGIDKLERKHLVLVAVAGVVVFGGAVTLYGGGVQETRSVGDWQEVKLEDVSTGKTFTVAELEKPVLVETFAVWCPTCTRQQKEIKKYHRQYDANSVSLDVDPNEDASKVRSHIQRHGFGWRYAVAPPQMTKLLIDRYGNSIVHPPSSPMILVCENGTRRLPDGVKPVSKLREEVEAGC